MSRHKRRIRRKGPKPDRKFWSARTRERYDREQSRTSRYREPEQEIAEEIEAAKRKYYDRYFFLKTGISPSGRSSGLTAISDLSEIDEATATIRFSEVENIVANLASERSDTPIDFSSEGELDNLFFEIKLST